MNFNNKTGWRSDLSEYYIQSKKLNAGGLF